VNELSIFNQYERDILLFEEAREQKDIDMFIENSYICDIYSDVISPNKKKFKIGVVFNSSLYSSALGNSMCRQLDVDIAFLVNLNKEKIEVRTAKEDINLNRLMKEYFRGGGHQKAAGGFIGNVTDSIIRNLLSGFCTVYAIEKAKKQDAVAVMLKKYFNDLFYNNRVQTFIYMDLTEWRIYDQYMIEFLIRNRILDNGYDDYVHVCHQLMIPDTFSIDYDKTFFRAFEKNSKKLLSKSNRAGYPEDIISYGTTFASRYEKYFKFKYDFRQMINSGQPFPDELMYAILDNKLATDDHPEVCKWRNILIKYFNPEDGDITDAELEAVEELPFERSVEAFYMIPLLIFCLEKSIETLIN
jgi:hypothetical protein